MLGITNQLFINIQHFLDDTHNLGNIIMDRSKRVVLSFLNSAEGYFHNKTIIEDGVKQPRNLYGPMSDRPEKWDYTDIRDITKIDLDNILAYALNQVDKELYQQIPSTALNAALQCAIHCFDNGRFQSKIDSNAYNALYKILSLKVEGRGV